MGDEHFQLNHDPRFEALREVEQLIAAYISEIERIPEKSRTEYANGRMDAARHFQRLVWSDLAPERDDDD